MSAGTVLCMMAMLAAAVTLLPLVHATQSAGAEPNGCRVGLGTARLSSAVKRNIGFLSGVGAATPDSAIARLAPHVIRGPFASQPFWTGQAARLAGLGVGSLQLILGPQVLETRWMAAEPGRNNSALRAACWPGLQAACPLPGSEADPRLIKWQHAVSQTVDEVEQLGLSGSIIYDIWNEPNFVGGPGGGGGGFAFPSEYWRPGPASRQGLTYRDFWHVWNVAVRTIRARQPQAIIVGPSAAPGPGVPEGSAIGWQPQKEWLQQFLLQAHANQTMPDILSWHDYTGRPMMVASMQSELRAFMASEGMPTAQTIPMGYNEIVDSAHAQSAGYHIVMAAALDLTTPPTDHAALGCWAEPGATKASSGSTCWDQSLDGLLDPDAEFKARPAWHALRWHAELPKGTRQWALDTASEDCRLGGIAAAATNGTNGSETSGAMTVLLGRWNTSSSTQLTLDLGASAVVRTVEVQRLPGDCRAQNKSCDGAEPREEAAIRVPAGPVGDIVLELREAEAVRLSVVPMKHDDGSQATASMHVGRPLSAGVWSWMCDRSNGLDECVKQVEDAPPRSLRGAIEIIFWRDLELADGVFNWSAFDANLAKAAKNGLQLQPLVYIYDCASPMPDFMANISRQIAVYRNGPEDGRICHAPDYLDSAFQDRWHRVIEALATHLAELPDAVKEKVWASQIVAGITGDNRPWKGVVQNRADAINASAWKAYTRSIADVYIDAFLKVGIPVVANLEDGFSGQQDQAWFLSRAYAKGMRGASVKEGVPSHFYNLNNESWTFNRESPLLLRPQPDGSFARARGEMDGGVTPNPAQDAAGSYGNWAQSPWWNLQANAEWALTFGLDVWNVNSGFLGDKSFTPTLDFFNRHAGHRNPANAAAAFISFRDSLDTANVNRWPVDKYGPVASKSHPDSLANKDRMIKIQQENKHRGAQLPPNQADYFASLHSVKQRKAPALFDVCWRCYPGNYGRFIEQVHPAATTIGYWQLGPVNQGYGRFARGLEHRTGKNKITVRLDLEFGVAGTRASIRVVYFDRGGGRWALGYDGTQVATVQKRNSTRWETAEANVTLGKSRDITLMSMNAEDDVFSLLEVLL